MFPPDKIMDQYSLRPRADRFSSLAEIFNHTGQDRKDDDLDDDRREVVFDHRKISEIIPPEDTAV
jgi:hypothetical protein